MAEPAGARTGARRVLAADDIGRAVTRMAHEVIEANRGLDGVAIVGIEAFVSEWLKRWMPVRTQYLLAGRMKNFAQRRD